ncbi:MAG: hypothetical protein ACI8QZ_001527 [Chlamydiales bacterium]|jgi:hypothetical protein
MAPRVRTRPKSEEAPEYFRAYTSLVPDGDIVELLRDQGRESAQLLAGVSEEQAAQRYAPGKWSLKEVVGHLTDMEWTFTYRAMRFARGDDTPLSDVDQDRLIAGAQFEERSLRSLALELAQVRAASTTLFESLSDEALMRVGTASGRQFTVRSMLYVTAGHELHHMRVLRERYLHQGDVEQ